MAPAKPLSSIYSPGCRARFEHGHCRRLFPGLIIVYFVVVENRLQITLLNTFMLKPEDVKRQIQDNLPCEFVDVRGDGQHFEAVIVSAAFRGMSRVQQHQIVYRTLGDGMRDSIHALSMKTYSPEEWTS